MQAILVTKCQRCHQAPPQHGAPFALLGYEDTQVRDSRGLATFERIARVVEAGSMPPLYLKLVPEVEALSDSERASILDWCAQGAPAPEATGCSITR